jgi:hypothetical protein
MPRLLGFSADCSLADADDYAERRYLTAIPQFLSTLAYPYDR